jgi:hypothetical protein
LKALILMLAIYAVPAAIFFGTTIGVLHASRRKLLLPIERGAWLLPGLVYALTPVLIWRLDMSGPPKGLHNLFDPVLVAFLCWLIFVARVTLAIRRPQANRLAAYATIAVNMAVAVAVLFLMPPLPQ